MDIFWEHNVGMIADYLPHCLRFIGLNAPTFLEIIQSWVNTFIYSLSSCSHFPFKYFWTPAVLYGEAPLEDRKLPGPFINHF